MSRDEVLNAASRARWNAKEALTLAQAESVECERRLIARQEATDYDPKDAQALALNAEAEQMAGYCNNLRTAIRVLEDVV